MSACRTLLIAAATLCDRAGMLGGCLLIRMGICAGVKEAIQLVRKRRCKRAVESRSQEQFIAEFARLWDCPATAREIGEIGAEAKSVVAEGVGGVRRVVAVGPRDVRQQGQVEKGTPRVPNPPSSASSVSSSSSSSAKGRVGMRGTGGGAEGAVGLTMANSLRPSQRLAGLAAAQDAGAVWGGGGRGRAAITAAIMGAFREVGKTGDSRDRATGSCRGHDGGVIGSGRGGGDASQRDASQRDASQRNASQRNMQDGERGEWSVLLRDKEVAEKEPTRATGERERREREREMGKQPTRGSGRLPSGVRASPRVFAESSPVVCSHVSLPAARVLQGHAESTGGVHMLCAQSAVPSPRRLSDRHRDLLKYARADADEEQGGLELELMAQEKAAKSRDMDLLDELEACDKMMAAHTQAARTELRRGPLPSIPVNSVPRRAASALRRIHA